MNRGRSLQSFGQSVVEGFKDKYYHLGEDLSSGQSYRVARGATYALLTAGGIVGGGSAVGINGLAARTAGKVRLFDRAEGVEGTGAYLSTAKSISQGLGKLEGREVKISKKGFDLVSKHLSQFGPVKENELMLQRLERALKNNQLLTGADASFYIHEATEATRMSRGIEYAEAHQFALNKYKVSPFSVYHPDVINQLNILEPGSFNNNWNVFWDDYQASPKNRLLNRR